MEKWGLTSPVLFMNQTSTYDRPRSHTADD